MAASSLSAKLEEQIQVYQDHLFGATQLWNYTALEVEVSSYFDQWWYNPSRVDVLFNRFAAVWGILYQLHRLGMPTTSGTCLWNTRRSGRRHKVNESTKERPTISERWQLWQGVTSTEDSYSFTRPLILGEASASVGCLPSPGS